MVTRSPTVAVAVSRRRVTALAATRRFLSRKSLNDTIASQHTPIDRKVTADHEGTHSCVLLGQNIRFVCEVCLVFASIDKNKASVAAVVPVALVHGVCPSSASAKALEVLHVETAHCDVAVVGSH